MRILIALLVALALPAGAATLSIVPDKAFYTIGETITLTVIGDDQDATGPFYSLYGRLVYSAALTDPLVPAVQTAVGTGWILGTTPQIDGASTAFDQLNFNGGTGDLIPVPNGNVIATLKLIMAAPGVVNVTWASDLTFFGLTSAPGTSFSVVPEPGTAELLGLGLLALALGHRRRRCT